MPYKPMIQFKPGELRRLQDQAGYTNPVMSNKMGVSQGTWDRWLATGKVPTRQYPLLCEVLGIEQQDAGEPLSPVQENQIELLRREVRGLHSDLQVVLTEVKMLRAELRATIGT